MSQPRFVSPFTDGTFIDQVGEYDVYIHVEGIPESRWEREGLVVCRNGNHRDNYSKFYLREEIPFKSWARKAYTRAMKHLDLEPRAFVQPLPLP